MVSIMDIKEYLKQHGTTSENELATHFDTTPAIIEMMCEKLREKGQADLVVVESHCGCACGCGGKPKRSWRLKLV